MAIAVDKGKGKVPVADRERVSLLAKDLFDRVAGAPGRPQYFVANWGTVGLTTLQKARAHSGARMVKNLTTNLFPPIYFGWDTFGDLFDVKPRPCWACRFKHCHIMTVKEGRYAGYIGEEPEADQWSVWGSLIGQTDAIEAFVLSNEGDRLGLDVNESGWVIAWMMECFEKGLLTDKDTDGIAMRWGDAEATLAMLRKIARREGIGNILAEGVLRATKLLGPEAERLAVYTKKGNSPRAQDHRHQWHAMLDTCVGDTGLDEGGSHVLRPQNIGLPSDTDIFSADVAAKIVSGLYYRMPLDDCIGMCRYNNKSVDADYLADLITAVTGWNFTGEEAKVVGYRVANLLRVFNLRHGLTADLDAPSARYSSTPIDGANQGKTIRPVWDDMVEQFYGLMGWDKETSRPLPETLTKLGLENVIKDIW